MKTLVKQGKTYRRHVVKDLTKIPYGFWSDGPVNPITGAWPGWVPVPKRGGWLKGWMGWMRRRRNA